MSGLQISFLSWMMGAQACVSPRVVPEFVSYRAVLFVEQRDDWPGACGSCKFIFVTSWLTVWH